MKSIVLLFVIINLLPVCLSCDIQKELSGKITYSTTVIGSKCWIIQVPDGSYALVNVEKFTSPVACIYTKLEIKVAGIGASYEYCPRGTNWVPVVALSDVNITLVTKTRYNTSFTLNYTIESQACGQMDHFRCSNQSCISENKVCDGVKDCENGADEESCDARITSIKGVNASRENALKVLLSKRLQSFGWGPDTPRAILAIYSANQSYLNNTDIETNLTLKEMQLQTAVIILKNFVDLSTLNDLSIFIGALAVTCHNPRQFYGYDLLQILSDKLSSTSDVSAYLPTACLTFCNGNLSISENQADSLIKLLSKTLPEASVTKDDATTLMALTCIKSRTEIFDKMKAEDAKVYNDTINKIISKQGTDGAFGDQCTTALVTQAMLSAAKAMNRSWNLRLTINYLLTQNSDSYPCGDFYSLVLPILNGKSYTNIAEVKCDKFREQDAEVASILGKVVGQMRVKYSLYIGDQTYTNYTNNFRVPERSSVYDVMKIAAEADPKYKFVKDDAAGIMNIYEINGIKNDPESGTYWLIYTKDAKDTDVQQTASPDQIFLKEGEHFILWYKTLTI